MEPGVAPLSVRASNPIVATAKVATVSVPSDHDGPAAPRPSLQVNALNAGQTDIEVLDNRGALIDKFTLHVAKIASLHLMKLSADGLVEIDAVDSTVITPLLQYRDDEGTPLRVGSNGAARAGIPMVTVADSSIATVGEFPLGGETPASLDDETFFIQLLPKAIGETTLTIRVGNVERTWPLRVGPTTTG